MSRPTRDEYFMEIAQIVAKRSTCDRAHVGAVLVRQQLIISTGYNGSVRNLPHCDEVGHHMMNGHCMRAIHAEQNAVIQAALNGVSTSGATLYVTVFPCIHCTMMVLNAGIRRIHYLDSYQVEHYSFAFELIRASNVELIHMGDS